MMIFELETMWYNHGGKSFNLLSSDPTESFCMGRLPEQSSPWKQDWSW